VIVIQELITTWTAASRGGAGAAQRNATPRVLPLPAHAGTGVRHHVVTFDEASAFAPVVTSDTWLPALPERLHCIAFAEAAEGVVVSYQWDRSCGAPRRDLQPPRRLFVVHAGELGRAIHNGRFGGEDRWSYRQVVTNVAVIDEAGRFGGLQPAALADLRARLR
jgi:hypothetical protein